MASGVSDPEDGFAVAMAYYAKRFEILGVVVTFGNDEMAPQLAAVRLLVHDLMKAVIPVLAGVAVPLSDPVLQWTAGREAGKGLPEPCGNEGVDFMIHQLRKATDKVTIVAIGPLTDTACVVVRHPDLAAKIAGVVAIMGRKPDEDFFIGKFKNLTDFNLRRDSREARVLLSGAQVPLTFIGFSATKKGLLTSGAVESTLSPVKTGLARFFLQAAKSWIVQWRDTWKFGEDASLLRMIWDEDFGLAVRTSTGRHPLPVGLSRAASLKSKPSRSDQLRFRASCASCVKNRRTSPGSWS